MQPEIGRLFFRYISSAKQQKQLYHIRTMLFILNKYRAIHSKY